MRLILTNNKTGKCFVTRNPQVARALIELGWSVRRQPEQEQRKVTGWPLPGEFPPPPQEGIAAPAPQPNEGLRLALVFVLLLVLFGALGFAAAWYQMRG